MTFKLRLELLPASGPHGRFAVRIWNRSDLPGGLLPHQANQVLSGGEVSLWPSTVG